MTILQKNTFCSFCGTEFDENQPFPRICSTCRNVVYLNPIPVVVGLVPVGKGLLGVLRNIEPKKGFPALPGGFMDFGETWQQGVAREVCEETGIELESEKFRFFNVLSPEDGKVVLIFGLYEEIVEEPADFKPNSEVSELLVFEKPMELAFPLHTQVLKEYFEKTGL